MAFYSKRYFLRVIVYVLALFVTVQESTAINSKSCKGFFSPDREDLHLNILDNLTNFHSSLKSRLNKEGINFKYPEIKIEFEVLLKNEEIAKKFGRKLDTLRSKGYPYEKCLIQIFDILFNIDKANDPKILKQAYEVVYQERYIKFSNSVRRVLEKGYFFYPSFREVNIYEINQMLIAGVLPLGLTLTSVNADGMTYSPTTFLTHDSSTHTSQMRNEVSYTPSRWENAKIFLEKDKKWSGPEKMDTGLCG